MGEANFDLSFMDEQTPEATQNMTVNPQTGLDMTSFGAPTPSQSVIPQQVIADITADAVDRQVDKGIVKGGVSPQKQNEIRARETDKIQEKQPGFFEGLKAAFSDPRLSGLVGGAIGGAIGAAAGGGGPYSAGQGAILGAGGGAQAGQQEYKDQLARLGLAKKAEREDAKDKEQTRQFELELAERKRQFDNQMALTNAKLEDAAKTTKFKGPEFQAATFGQRVSQASDVFDKLEKEGFDAASLGTAARSKLPVRLQGEQIQQQQQAERNFVNAVLRRESGAAIAESEFTSAEKQYFPRPGDTKTVLENKKKNRQLALSGLKAEAGGAWDEVGKVFQEVTGNAQPAKSFKGVTIDPVQVSVGKVIIKNGKQFRFKGGDPTSASNWEAL